ncbi:MAG: hypothetical protein IJO52_12225, partial [Clostridia bacterium]|nr:hypothetical protein [Clostridia bacterium]
MGIVKINFTMPSDCRQSRATATGNKRKEKTRNRYTIEIAGDTSNITCYLSLFAASIPTVPLYADRLEATKYHRLFESLSVCR